MKRWQSSWQMLRFFKASDSISKALILKTGALLIFDVVVSVLFVFRFEFAKIESFTASYRSSSFWKQLSIFQQD